MINFNRKKKKYKLNLERKFQKINIIWKEYCLYRDLYLIILYFFKWFNYNLIIIRIKLKMRKGIEFFFKYLLMLMSI